MLINNFTQQQEYKSSYVVISASQNTGALLLGDLKAVSDLDTIKKYDIKTIITAASGLEHIKVPSEISHIVFPLQDKKQEKIQNYFEINYLSIEQNLKRGSVLVNCGSGISKSATLMIAYYMKKFNQTFQTAFHYLRKIKPNICPNIGFQNQLKNYEKKLQISNQSLKIINKKDSIHDKTPKISSPYEFNFPINEQDTKKRIASSKKINHPITNKIKAEKVQQKVLNMKSGFLVQGKNTQKQKQQRIKKQIQAYDPTKYQRKRI